MSELTNDTTGRAFPWQLSWQTTLPLNERWEDETYFRWYDDDFSNLLATLQEIGLWGVEINIEKMWDFRDDYKRRDTHPSELGEYLQDKGLEFSMLATGAEARRVGMSLSDADERGRRDAVSRCREMIDLFCNGTTWLIVGYLKGGVVHERLLARDQFQRSIEELAPAVRDGGTRLLIEATNRYESSVANSLDEAASFALPWREYGIFTLADTFHMNIEESDSLVALERNLEAIGSIHLSDNNRRLPGDGAIDFGSLLKHLDAIGYRGRLGIEGDIEPGEAPDVAVRRSVGYLRRCWDER